MADGPGAALDWLRKAIQEHNWWYRPEVLEDEDLAALQSDTEFLSLKAISDDRYWAALSKSTAILSWKKKTADNLLLAIHGNTQNGDVARADWEPIVGARGLWQLETVQSAQPDGYGTYRWSYDSTSYLPVANSLERIQDQGYHKIACGAEDEDCLPMAKQLYAVAKQAGCNVTLTVQENTRHQFPVQPYHV